MDEVFFEGEAHGRAECLDLFDESDEGVAGAAARLHVAAHGVAVESRGAHRGDEGEFLEVEKIPLDALVKMVMDGEIPDAKTQIAILKAYRILSERKKVK